MSNSLLNKIKEVYKSATRHGATVGEIEIEKIKFNILLAANNAKRNYKFIYNSRYPSVGEHVIKFLKKEGFTVDKIDGIDYIEVLVSGWAN